MNPIATFLSAAVLSSAIATGALSQTADNGKKLVASTSLKLSADQERSGFVTVTKQFIVPFAGVVRVRWQLKSDGSGALASATVTSTIGTCSSTNSTAIYQVGTCNLRVVAGDLVRVSAQGTVDFTTFVTSIAFIKTVRIFFNVVDNPGTGQTLIN